MMPHSHDPNTTAREDSAESITSSRSSVSVSIGGTASGENRSESPRPRRSVAITRARLARPRRNRARNGLSQFRSRCEQYPWR